MRCKWYNICPLRVFEKKGLIDESWRKKYCEGNFKECARYKMEEAGKPHPDNLMPDGTIRKDLPEHI